MVKNSHIRYGPPSNNGNPSNGHIYKPLWMDWWPSPTRFSSIILSWHMRLEDAATMTLQKIQVRAACSCFLGLDLLSFECSMFLLSCWLLDFQNWKGSGMIWTKAWRKHDGMMVRNSDGSLRCQFVKLTYIRNCWMLSTVVGSIDAIDPKLA